MAWIFTRPQVLARHHFSQGDVLPDWLSDRGMVAYIQRNWPGLLTRGENPHLLVGSAPEAGKGLPEGDRVQDGGFSHHTEARTAPSGGASEPAGDGLDGAEGQRAKGVCHV